jgi:hypothetical protein
MFPFAEPKLQVRRLSSACCEILSICAYAVVLLRDLEKRLQTGRASDMNEREKLAGGSNVLANFASWVLPGMDWTGATASRASAVTARWRERMMWFDYIG